MKRLIRPETEKDYDAVYQLVESAFQTAEHTDHDEQNLVVRLRKSRAFVPALSLVAEADGRIVGHILFTEIKVGGTTQLALAPLSVVPDMQGKGVGGSLIREGHRIAKNLGYGFSVVLGHEEYYPRFGYRKASGFGIRAPFEVPDECFMALNLQGGEDRLNGVVEYAPEFFAN